MAGIFLSYLYFSFDGNEAAPSRNGPKSADDPRTCPQLHRLQLRATLASFVRNNFLGTDQPRGPMRGASWTTHPTTRRTDDIDPLASKTTHNDEYQDPSARGLSGARQPTSRRRSPMAGIRWGEASKPGPLGDRRFGGWTKTLAANGKYEGSLRDRQPASSEGGSMFDPAIKQLPPGGYVTLRGVSKPMLCTHPTSCGPLSHGASCEGPDAVVGLSRGRPIWSYEPSAANDLEDGEDSEYEDQDEARAPTSPDWDDSAPEEVEVIPTVDVEAPTPLASGRTRLRAPASLYHLFCGGVGGFLGAMASGFSLIGGCDTSERARLTFTNIAHAPTTVCMLRAFGVLWWCLLLGYGGFVGGAAPGVCEWGAVTRCSLSLSSAGPQRR